ncbi:hypothetical protein FOA52_014120 [Chlamydomonas sp. UWO 241]|nr:hypothetical protein FOA52_014120 [Chlamydomonas sp. UWO 241]
MPFLGIGGRREQELKAHRDSGEVRFWKSELDKSCEEKNQWVGKFAAAARTNEILRAEVFLLQQDSLALRSQLELNVRRSTHLPGGWVPGWADDISKPSAALSQPHQRQQPQPQPQLSKRYPASAAVAQGVRDERTLRDQPGGAKQQAQDPRNQAPSELQQGQQEQQEQQAREAAAAAAAAKAEAEVAALRRQLWEAGTYVARMQKDLEQQRKQHENEKTLLSATVEAYRNEADLLREQVTFQHGINDFTADETLKLHYELGRLQQSNASLQRDVSLKDGMIQLLQQEVAEELGSHRNSPTASLRSRIEEEAEDEGSLGCGGGQAEDKGSLSCGGGQAEDEGSPGCGGGRSGGRASPAPHSGGGAVRSPPVPVAHAHSGVRHARGGSAGSGEGSLVWSGVTPRRAQARAAAAAPAAPTGAGRRGGGCASAEELTLGDEASEYVLVSAGAGDARPLRLQSLSGAGGASSAAVAHPTPASPGGSGARGGGTGGVETTGAVLRPAVWAAGEGQRAGGRGAVFSSRGVRHIGRDHGPHTGSV